MIEIRKYGTLNPEYIAVEPLNPKADFKPDGGKYELHSAGKVVGISKNTEGYINSLKLDNAAAVIIPFLGDEILYDPSKSITIIEANAKLEFVPLSAILAVKGDE